MVSQAVAKLAGAQMVGVYPSLERSISGSHASAEPPEGSGSGSAEDAECHAARSGMDGAGGLQGLAEAAEQGTPFGPRGAWHPLKAVTLSCSSSPPSRLCTLATSSLHLVCPQPRVSHLQGGWRMALPQRATTAQPLQAGPVRTSVPLTSPAPHSSRLAAEQCC